MPKGTYEYVYALRLTGRGGVAYSGELGTAFRWSADRGPHTWGIGGCGLLRFFKASDGYVYIMHSTDDFRRYPDMDTAIAATILSL